MSFRKAEVFEEFRPELIRLAYRMTGLWSEAEDLVQDAWLRFSSSQVDHAKPFLYRVVTRLCLDYLKSARNQRETYIGPWLPEPKIEFSVADEMVIAEEVTLSLLLALENLSPAERAVFILRQLYEIDYTEIGEFLGRSEAACRKLLSRARGRIKDQRKKLDANRAQGKQPLTGLVNAVRSGDVDQVMEFLHQDAILVSDGGGKALAALQPIVGADKISRFFVGIGKKFPSNSRVWPALVGGHPGLCFFEGEKCVTAMAVEFHDRKIQSLWLVRNPDKLTKVGEAPSS